MIAFPFLFILAAALVVPDANLSLYLFDKMFAKKAVSSLKGKRIWITGASSGIGAELAKQLYDHDANIIISGRRQEELQKVQSACKQNKNLQGKFDQHISILPFDVTDSDENLSLVVKEALSHYDGLDILILNAGAGQRSLSLDESYDTTRKLMDINYMGPVRLALETMKQGKWETSKDSLNKGHIIATSSVAAKMALPLATSYSSSKFALHGFFTSLRSECSEWLRIDLPCPGPIATSFQDNVLTESKTGNDGENDSSSSAEVSMSPTRCAKLIISGMVGPSLLMQETWISKQPTLAFLYINQFFPKLNNFLLGIVGSLRIKAFRAGLPLYEVKSWIKAAKMDKEKKKDAVDSTKTEL